MKNHGILMQFSLLELNLKINNTCDDMNFTHLCNITVGYYWSKLHQMYHMCFIEMDL